MTGYQASTEQMKTLPVINPTFKSEWFLSWFSIVIVGDKMCLTLSLRFFNGKIRL